MAAEAPLIELREGYKVFSTGGALRGGKTVAVENVSFHMDSDPPRIVNLVGESGSGKSTIARMLLGLSRPSAGAALYRGLDIYRLRGAQFDAYRRDVQAVFQDPYSIFNPFYRIDAVFQMALRNFHLASDKDKGRQLVEDALRAVDLRPNDVLGRYPHQLSGGERQRVMLARTYMLRPKLIVADEPVSMLDAAVRALFLNILLDFKERHGISTLFITHDLSTAYYLGGDIQVMLRGRIVERGAVERVMLQPAHPYSQSLLQAIPEPDPEVRWRDHPAEGAAPVASAPRAAPSGPGGRQRCIFTDRCPHVMEICSQRPPPAYEVGPGQTAACFLYAPAATGAAVMNNAGK